MAKNSLILAAAGSGKTEYIVDNALARIGNVLITTFTESNTDEIKTRIIQKKKCLPKNITVQTWFSFLIHHGVKPYQGGIYNNKVRGLLLVNSPSALYDAEANTEKHYFSPGGKVYSDKLSKLVIKCNKQTSGEVLNRISRIFQHIFIDEVQDLASYDLLLLKDLFNISSELMLVGDVRQVTYLTHHARQYEKYRNGKIKDFIENECPKGICDIDETTLSVSHRNNAEICLFASNLYPTLAKSVPCSCNECRKTKEHQGVFLLNSCDVQKYSDLYLPQILVQQKAEFPQLNFGISKGRSFDRVLIHPTNPIKAYLKNGLLTKTVKTKKGNEIKDAFDIAKFYVAVTRARYSVVIVYDYDESKYIEGVKKFAF